MPPKRLLAKSVRTALSFCWTFRIPQFRPALRCASSITRGACGEWDTEFIFLCLAGHIYPEVLQELVDRGDIDGFSRLSEYKASGLVNAISRMFVVPGIRNRMLRSQQQQALNEILYEVRRRDCDLIVMQQRMYLFAD